MAVPWAALVANLPTLIDSAGKLFKKADAPPRMPEVGGPLPQQIESLSQRLAYYEQLEAEQAKLLKQTIEQLTQVAAKAQAAERRATVASVVAGASGVLALIAMGMLLVLR